MFKHENGMLPKLLNNCLYTNLQHAKNTRNGTKKTILGNNLFSKSCDEWKNIDIAVKNKSYTSFCKAIKENLV